ncbi:MAG: N-acetylglucosamine-6-phosphate deacetylase [Bacteroidales bacterium]|nr:N-acetylglucosamine-6-phosphate deacetylase [Bacteroidales bacterium]
MAVTVFRGGRFLLPEGVRTGIALVVRDGRIEAVVPESEAPEGEAVDAGGQWVSPGFIDLHVHGGWGHDFLDGTVEAYLVPARRHALHGTTTMTPSLATASFADYERAVRAYRKALPLNKEGAQFAGIHFEGPFFSPAKAGAQDASLLKDPTPEHYLPLLEAFPETVRVSAAPELEGAMGLGEELKRRGIVAAIAHTDASCATCEEAFRHGYSLMTHFYCAMSTVAKRGYSRYAGAVEAGYLQDFDIEVIADGEHLPVDLLRLVYRIKGADRVVLCTDAIRATGLPDGEYIQGSLENGLKFVVENGVALRADRGGLAGSVATTDRLVRTMARAAGLPDAVRMMTENPARILGLSAKGRLAPGCDADIVLFDDDVRVSRVFLSGRELR